MLIVINIRKHIDAIIFLKLKVKETKGTDLNKVGEGEAE